jgi:hypothetical protein
MAGRLRGEEGSTAPTFIHFLYHSEQMGQDRRFFPKFFVEGIAGLMRPLQGDH